MKKRSTNYYNITEINIITKLQKLQYYRRITDKSESKLTIINEIFEQQGEFIRREKFSKKKFN